MHKYIVHHTYSNTTWKTWFRLWTMNRSKHGTVPASWTIIKTKESQFGWKLWKCSTYSNYSYLDKQCNKIIALILLGTKFLHCLWQECHSCISNIHILKYIFLLINHARKILISKKKIGRKKITSQREIIAFMS